MADDRLVLRSLELDRVWNVRGDAADPSFMSAVEQTLRLTLPTASHTTTLRDSRMLWSIGPTSWLFFGDDRNDEIQFDSTRRALNDAGAALFDISASNVAWSVTGAQAPRVLNRLCPLDLDRRSFAAQTCAQSVLGHINATFYKHDDTPTFVVLVARSFALDAWTALETAATTDGYDVGATIALSDLTKIV